MADAIVLGASCPLGSYIVDALVAAGYCVTGVSRGQSPRALPAGVAWEIADLMRPEAVGILPASSIMVSALPIWATVDVCKIACARGLSRLVAFSSTSAITKKEAASAADRELSKRLLEGEEALASLPRNVAVTVLRPTMIHSDRGDRNVQQVASQLRKISVFPLVGAGRGLRQPVHARDLATAAVAALAADNSISRTYDLGGGEVLTFREMVARTARANELKVHFVRVPRVVALAGVRALGRRPQFRGITRGALERMRKDLVCDISLAGKDLNYSPRRFEPPSYGI